MGNVIEVDWPAVRAQRDQVKAQAQTGAVNQQSMTQSQVCVLRLAEMRLTEEEYVELCAACADYDCYMQATNEIQLLVDIYQLLEAF